MAIARALSYGPSIIVADEPTGNLVSGAGRPATQDDIMGIFRMLAHDEHRCVIIVTHSPEVAKTSDSLPLKGRHGVALVTGASRGIAGAAIALRLVRAGACVAIYIRMTSAKRCAQRIMDDREAAGRVITCKADVTDAGQVHDMVRGRNVRRIGHSRQ